MVFAALLALAACGAEPPAPPLAEPAPRIPLGQVLAAVQSAPAIRHLPATLTPPLTSAATDLGFDSDKCEAAPAADRIEPCVFGDRAAGVDVVLYGDASAAMWLPAMIPIAERRHWRLRFFGKPSCPAPDLRSTAACDRFRDYVTERLRRERPDLIVVTTASFGVTVTSGQWQTALRRTLTELRGSAARLVVLGGIPVLDESGPQCLAAHPDNVLACAITQTAATARVWHAADEAAARAVGADYVSVLPWLCAEVCTPVIGDVAVYRNRFQLTATYARMLNGVLEDALPKLSAAGAKS